MTGVRAGRAGDGTGLGAPGGRAPARTPRRRHGYRTGGASSGARGGRARLQRMGWRTLGGVLSSPKLAALSLALFFLLFSVDFLIVLHPFDSLQSLVFEQSGAGFTDSRLDDAGAVKRSAGLLVYALGLLMLLVHRRAVGDFFLNHPRWILIFLVVLTGMLWSIEPAEVLNNTIQLMVGMVLAIAYAATRPPGMPSLRSLCTLLVVTLGLLHLAGLVLFVTQVDGPVDFFAGRRRYGGAFGNPNTSAGNAVLGVWAAMTLLSVGRASRPWRWCARGALAVFVFSIAVSGSASSTVTGAGVAGLVLWLGAMRRLNPNQRVIGNLFGVLVAVLAGGALLLGTDSNVAGEVAGSLGKDATFTGRTQLWAMAREAISQKPLLGWSLDSHVSVIAKPEFEIPYPHYHNGYLDLLINGGVLLGSLVLYDLVRFALLWRRATVRVAAAMLTAVPLFIVAALNLTEYSLLRPLSPIWQVYVCTLALLAVSFRDAGRIGRPHAGARRPALPARAPRHRPAGRFSF